ncbi:Hypothetical predicted protein [Pelobates cultripes]|uniref:Fish-egg lectin n=1 Tax=Pelobates cultripes TaxID=61616 RepID=A0AAD1WR84_PELCU|nr:Hypothetical predicted protein [Pelobates cultripes]
MKFYICLTLMMLDVAAGLQCTLVPGKLKQIDAGAGQVYGVNDADDIFRLNGALKQVDAGGNVFLGGVNSADNIYCLSQDLTLSKGTSLPFIQLDGSLKYYSCGRYSCWGVNSNNDIFYRLNVSPNDCKGSEWRQVDGNMIMVEVATDGSVYGINTIGNVYKREGISFSNPGGTEWSLLTVYGPFKHVSYDNGVLWLLDSERNIFKCDINYYS